MTSPDQLYAGRVVWAALDPVRGREQGGHRPVLVVSGAGFLSAVTTLLIAVPITTVDRDWPNHVRLDGESRLPRESWAMTEQMRAMSRDRITAVSGFVTLECLGTVKMWLADFLELAP